MMEKNGSSEASVYSGAIDDNDGGNNGVSPTSMEMEMEMETSRDVEVTEEKDLKTSIAGVAGNVLEWYDFAIFGYFSDIIGDNFFPKAEEGSHSSLVKSFVVFGAAFLARPLGGAIIGLFGDSVGRKTALEVSVFLMAFPTFALGCLPTYESIGGLATFFLVMLRLLQGVSVGGQLMSSVVFTLESRDVSRWGLWGSSVYAFSSIGVVIGSLFSYILREALTDDQLHDWGWRIPFFFGILGVIPALYLRLFAEELHQAGDGNDEENTLKRALKKENLLSLCSAILIVSVSAASYYLIAIWLPMYMETIRDPAIPHAFAISTVVGLIAVPTTFLGGWFADMVSPKAWRFTLLVSSAILGVLSPIFFNQISSNKKDIGVVAFFCDFLLTFAMIIFNGALTPFLVSLFPVEIRLTSLAISYNVALCLFGGFAPSVGTLLADKDKDATPAGFIITVLSAFSIIGLSIAPPNQYTTNQTLYVSESETKNIQEQGAPNDLEVPEIS